MQREKGQRPSIPFPGPGGKGGPPQKPPTIPPDVNRPVVVIESPYSGDVEKNVEFAKAVCRFYTKAGMTVVASHLFYTQFLDDDDPRERQIGIHCGFGIGVRTAAFVVFALPLWASDLTRGMSQAMDFYKEVGEKPCYVAKFNAEGTDILHGEWK